MLGFAALSPVYAVQAKGIMTWVVAIVGAIVLLFVFEMIRNKNKHSIADNRTAISITPGSAPGVIDIAVHP